MAGLTATVWLALATGGPIAAEPKRSGLDASLDDPGVRRILERLEPGLRPVEPTHPPFTEIPEARQQLIEVEQAKRQREARRTTPQAVADRVRSRTIHRGLARGPALDLARARFPELFSEADRRLLPLRPGEQVERYTGPSTAVIDGGGPNSLVASTVPLRARDERGELNPVDFDLQRTASGWEPANAAVPVAFGESSSEALSFQGDFTIAPAGSEVAGVRASNEIFFAGVARDTDAWFGPTPTGGRVAFQLRSPESPEELRLSVEAAPGTTLRLAGQGPTQRVEILEGGEQIGVMSAPLAFDADDKPIEIGLRVDGTDVVIELPHRDDDLLYPLVVDPVFENQDSWKYGNPNNAGWQYNEWNGSFDHNFSDFGIGTGFSVGRRTNQWYHGSSFGEWQYPALNGYTYIHRADFIHPTHWADRTTNRFGMWSIYWGGFQHVWATQAGYSWPDQYISICADGAATIPACDEHVNFDQSHGNYVMASISPDVGGSWPGGAWIHFGGARVWMSDQDLPDVWYWYEPPLGWYHDTPAGQFNGANEAHVRMGDPGVGMWGIWMDVPGRSRQFSSSWGGCTGVHSSRCPDSRAHNFSYAGMSEGRQTVTVTGQDVLAKTQSRQRVVRIDRSPPALDFRGSTLHQGGQTLVAPTHDLRIVATDGSTASEAQKRSGVRTIEVFVRRDTDALFDPANKDKDGRLQGQGFTLAHSAGPQSCAADHGSCSLETTWRVNRSQYDQQPGEYTVRVVAKDQLAHVVPAGQASAHTATREFTMIVPPRDQTDRAENRLGLEHWWAYETTDTGDGTAAHVNLSNGNLVWHSEPIFNLGRGLSSLVNLTYNSQQRVQLPLLETPVEQLFSPYDEVGKGFSMGISSLTRLNERLNVDLAPAGRVTLTDPDGTRHVFKAEAAGSDVFKPPPGVQLHLRRFSRSLGLIDAPMFGFERLEQPDKAWAATRPDGVTHYFDQLGYQTSVEDRNDNVIRFNYDYRSPTRDACRALNQPTNLNIFFLPGDLCLKKVVSVTDPGGRNLTIVYEQRTLADLPPESIPNGPLPPALVGQTVETPAYASGRVKTITDHGSRVLELAYDPDGYLTSMTRAKGSATEQKFRFAYEQVQAPLKIKPLVTIVDPRTPADDPASPSAIRTRIEYEPRTTADSLTELLLFDREVIAIQDRQVSSGALKDLYNVDQATRVTTVTDTRNFTRQFRFDGRGRMTESTDPLGTRTLVEWDDATTNDNNMAKVTEAANTGDVAVTSMAYNQNGALTEHTSPKASADPAHGKTTLTYADSEGPASRQSPRTTGNPPVSIDANRKFVSDLGSVTTPRGFTTSFTYHPDGRGNVHRRIDAEGHETETHYHQFGLVSLERDEVGNEWEFPLGSYSPHGLPGEVIDPRDKVWKFSYDQVGNTTSVADPRADGSTCQSAHGPRHPFTTDLTYDPLDRLVEEVAPKDSANCSFVKRSWVYNQTGNMRSATDATGAVTQQTWTRMEWPELTTSPVVDHVDGAAAEVTRRSYDNEGNLTAVASPAGMATTQGEDFTTRFSVDAIDRVTVMTRRSRGAVNKDLVTSYAYDRRDNVVGLVDPLRNERFGGNAQTNAATEARRRFTFAYDKNDNRTVQVEDPGAGVDRTEYGYDQNDNLVSLTDPRGFEGGGTPAQFTRRWGYDKRDLLIDVTDAKGRRTHYRLRGDGRVAAVITPRGTAGFGNDSQYFRTDFTYWPTGELKTRTLPKAPNQYAPVSPQIKYGLDAQGTERLSPVGDPLTIVDARGNAFSNTFFDTGELKTTTRPSWWGADPEPVSASGSEETLGGDDGVPAPRAALPEPPGLGSSVRERGEGGRAADEAPSLPRSHGFGDFGEVAPEPLPDLLPRMGPTTFAYDNEMRLARVTDTAGVEREVARDALGRMTQLTLPLDAAADRLIDTRHAYDRNGNLARVTQLGAWRKPDGTTADLVTNFGYDQFDRRTSVDAPGADASTRELTVLGYDANDRLVSRQTPRGPAFTWTYAFDDLDRMTSATNPAGDRTSFGYDPAGNRTLVTTPRGKVWDPAHDAANQLTSVTDPAGQVTSYTYDDNGNLVREVAPGAAAAPGGSTATRVIERTFDGRDLPWSETVGSGTHARTTVTEFDPNGNLRRTVNPAGVNQSTRLPINAWNGTTFPVTSNATEHATVRRYNAQDVMTSVHLPYGDIDGSGPAPAADTHRYRLDFEPDSRGRIRWVNSAYDWADPCPTPDPDDPGCPSQTEVERFDSDWIRSTSRPRLVAPGSFAAHAEKELVYDYDARGNQRLWRTPLNEPERRVVEREYAPNGTLTKRLARHTGDPTGRSYTYTHNANHSLTSFRDVQLRRTTAIAYDAAERPTLIDEDWDEEAGTPPAQRKSRDTLLRYDREGSVLHRLTDGQANGDDPATFAGGKTTSFRYNDLGRETAMWVCRSGGPTCDPGAGASPDRTTTTTYWPSSGVRERTKPNGVIESLFFYNDSRLARMVRKKGTATRKDQAYIYDNNGNRGQDERGVHRYNARNQHAVWQRHEAAGPDKPPGSEVHYTVNGSGATVMRRFYRDGSQQELTRTETFRYNGDRLRFVTAEEPGKQPATAAFCYDQTGFGEVSRIEDSGTCPQNLDASLTAGDTKYRYDDLSRLIASRTGGQAAETRFTYDGLDRRDRKIEQVSGADQTFEYFYVGLSERLSGEQDSGRVKVKGYDYDSKLWSQGQETKTSTATRYRSYAIDANGSVEGLEDSEGRVEDCQSGSPPPGCKSDRYRYDPYGELETPEADLSSDAKENPLRFEGFYYDPGARTYDMHARPYRPEVGRFMTEDHFEAASGDLALLSDPLTNNRYAFAGGNPVDNIEFDGHIGTTGGPDSRHVVLASGETFDRKRGVRTSGPNEGTGPGPPVGTEPAVTVTIDSRDRVLVRPKRTSLGSLDTMLHYLLAKEPQPRRLSLEEARTLKLLHEQRGEFTNDIDYLFGVGGLVKSVLGKRLARRLGFGGAAAAAGRGLPFEASQVADTAIYREVRNGEVIYVGITRNLRARSAFHHRTRGYRIAEAPGLQGVRFTRGEAHGVEQALIEIHRLGKHGGTLENRINSIARTNPIRAQSVRYGVDVLARTGYPGARGIRWRLRLAGARDFATGVMSMTK